MNIFKDLLKFHSEDELNEAQSLNDEEYQQKLKDNRILSQVLKAKYRLSTMISILANACACKDFRTDLKDDEINDILLATYDLVKFEALQMTEREMIEEHYKVKNFRIDE